MRNALIGAAALAAAAIGWLVWRPAAAPVAATARPHSALLPPVAGSDLDARRAAVAAALPREPAAPPPNPVPPRSLRNTAVDGALAVDADGRLLVTPDLRRFFEYFFIASGEEAVEQTRARIEAAIVARLDGEPAQQARALLARYLDYRERGRELAAAADGDDLEARFAELQRLRRETLGAEDAAALFADEDALLAAALESRRIAADASLTDAQRQAALAAVDERLPASARAAHAASTLALRLGRDEAALLAAGGSPEEIQALREQTVGAAAAARLAELDQRRAAWNQRVDAYRRERAIIESASATDSDRQQAVEALRARHFSGAELLRIDALDRLQASAPVADD